jgi:hypothetical protein
VLDTLKRKLGMTPDTAQAETVKEEVTMSEKETVAAVAENQVDVAALQASVLSLTSQLSDATSKITELNSLVEAATEFNANKEKVALEVKLADRKSKVEAAVGTAKAESVMAAVAGLDDGAFATVLSAMTTSTTTEASTSLFVEQGVDASADVAAIAKAAESNPVLDILQAKYPTK